MDYEANSADFVDALAKRIESIRATIKIDPTKQLKGLRFKDISYTIEAIQGAVLSSQNPNAQAAEIQKEALGLRFDLEQINMGYFDSLIRFVLRQLAIMDFEYENRIDLN